MTSRTTIIFLRIALGMVLLGIGYLAVIPLEPSAANTNDKLQHLVAFLMLAMLVDVAFPHPTWNWRKYLPLLGYGLLLEIIQYFVPSRYFSLADLAADAIGVACYTALKRLLRSSLDS
jgi:VanZ family protein